MNNWILSASNDEIRAEMERIRVMYQLKYTLRYKSQRDQSVHSESVAEHMYAMNVIAQYFYPYEDPQGKLDRIRVNELMLFHELGEIETGDIISHLKTDEDRAHEIEAANRVVQLLPVSMRQTALERHSEYEECITPEAKYAKAVDKIEPIFEMWDESLALPLFKKYNVNRAAAIGQKYEATKDYPCMRRFIEAWEERLVALDVFPA